MTVLLESTLGFMPESGAPPAPSDMLKHRALEGRSSLKPVVIPVWKVGVAGEAHACSNRATLQCGSWECCLEVLWEHSLNPVGQILSPAMAIAARSDGNHCVQHPVVNRQ